MAELTKKQRYWKAHLDALAAFDGSTLEYARQHDLDPKKLYVFKSVSREREALASTPTAFVNARPAAPMIGANGGVAVLLPNGVRLNLLSMDGTTLSQHDPHLESVYIEYNIDPMLSEGNTNSIDRSFNTSYNFKRIRHVV